MKIGAAVNMPEKENRPEKKRRKKLCAYTIDTVDAYHRARLSTDTDVSVREGKVSEIHKKTHTTRTTIGGRGVLRVRGMEQRF